MDFRASSLLTLQVVGYILHFNIDILIWIEHLCARRLQQNQQPLEILQPPHHC